MNKREYRKDLLSVARSWLFIMLFFFFTNFMATIYMEIRGFLFIFNMTCLIGTALIIFWLDLKKYKIIEGEI